MGAVQDEGAESVPLNDDIASLAEAPATASTEIELHLIGSDGLDRALSDLPEQAAAWARANRFSGAFGSWLSIPDPDRPSEIAAVLIGMGDQTQRDRQRFHLGEFARLAPAGTYRISGAISRGEGAEAALGWLLGRYRFDRYKGDKALEDAHLHAPAGVDGGRIAQIAAGVFVTRDMINTPANEMGPAAIEEAARKLGEHHGASVTAVTGTALIEQNFPMIHAVGRAAAEPPRLIELIWGDMDAPLVTVVGKGVAFDTGGLNLKPSASMGLMKKDMGGAATALGLAHMVMARGLGLRLRVLIPAVENAVSAGAMRPGDVLRSRKGLSVEVNNTDAEGRLILADALAYASEEKPELLVDFATLTGAARVALGPDVVPFFTDDETLAAHLAAASRHVADPMWRMPLWPGYEADIEPQIADLDNAPSGGMAGAITAALFLRRFVEAESWVHFDVYGWTPKARPGRPVGGECQAARTVFEILEARYPPAEDAAEADDGVPG